MLNALRRFVTLQGCSREVRRECEELAAGVKSMSRISRISKISRISALTGELVLQELATWVVHGKD